MLSTRASLRSRMSKMRYRYPLGLVSPAFAHTETASGAISPQSALENTRDNSGQNLKAQGLFFLDSVFPIRLGTLECVLFPKVA